MRSSSRPGLFGETLSQKEKQHRYKFKIIEHKFFNEHDLKVQIRIETKNN